MDQIEFPDEGRWNERKDWFERSLENAQHLTGGYMVSDQATALLVDLESCYCAGAFVAVIILSISIIDAQLRETESGDSKIQTYKLLNEYFTGEDINWLRKLRNSYVHLDINNPALKIDAQDTDRKKMEEDAQKAISIVIHSFFQSPWL